MDAREVTDLTGDENNEVQNPPSRLTKVEKAVATPMSAMQPKDGSTTTSKQNPSKGDITPPRDTVKIPKDTDVKKSSLYTPENHDLHSSPSPPIISPKSPNRLPSTRKLEGGAETSQKEEKTPGSIPTDFEDESDMQASNIQFKSDDEGDEVFTNAKLTDFGDHDPENPLLQTEEGKKAYFTIRPSKTEL